MTVTVCDDSVRELLVWSCADGEVDDGEGEGDCAPTATAIAAENTVPNMKSRFIKIPPR